VIAAKTRPPGSLAVPRSEPEPDVSTKSCAAAPPAPQHFQVPARPVAARAWTEPTAQSARPATTTATTARSAGHRVEEPATRGTLPRPKRGERPPARGPAAGRAARSVPGEGGRETRVSEPCVRAERPSWPRLGLASLAPRSVRARSPSRAPGRAAANAPRRRDSKRFRLRPPCRREEAARGRGSDAERASGRPLRAGRCLRR